MRRWTDEELAALRANYREHGRSWDGWGALLPGRTSVAIGAAAVRLGLYFSPGRTEQPRPEPERPEPEPESQPGRAAPGGGEWGADEDRLAVSALVLACSATGRKPSQVLDRLRQLTGAAVAAGDAGGKVGDRESEGRE